MMDFNRATLCWLLLLLLCSLGCAQDETSSSCPLTTTPSDALGPFYVENSPTTSFIGGGGALDNNDLLYISGQVKSASDCSGVGNVKIEVWYAGKPDEEGNFYLDAYRGQLWTDECGYYNYTQTFPALYPSRPILHTHVQLSKDDQALLVTQMYYLGTGQGFVSNQGSSSSSRSLQTVELEANGEAGGKRATFDFYVNAPGNTDCVANQAPTATTSVGAGAPSLEGTSSSVPKTSLALTFCALVGLALPWLSLA